MVQRFCLYAAVGALALLSFDAAAGVVLTPESFSNGTARVKGASCVVPADRPDATVHLRFVCRGPVSLAGANLVSFNAAGKEVKRSYLWPSLKMQAKSEWGKPSVHAYRVTADMIAPDAARVALRYYFTHAEAYDAAPPVFEILDDSIDWFTVPRSVRRGNFYVLGEDVVFRAPLPAGKTGLRVRVTDADGAEAFAGDVAGGEWRWRPAAVGFYTVRFAWLDAQGAAEPAVASFSTCRHDPQKGVAVRMAFAEFPRDCQSFAVTPTAPRGTEEAPPLFGFNLSPYQVIGPSAAEADYPFEIVRLLGMNAFIRYHRFNWDLIEAKGRGQYDWKDVDQALAVARRHGYGFDRILVNTFGTPAWLTTAPPDLPRTQLSRPQMYAPKDMTPWHDYIKAFVLRYPEMRYLELWNEPHLPGYSVFWQKSSPQQFVELMKAGYTGAKEAKPDITVLMGGQGMRYQPFYEQYVKLGGVEWFDQIDTHCGYNMQHFRETEKRLGAASKPYWEGEWHTVLYNCSAPEIPSEETCAYRMLTNMADLMHEDYTRITGFGLRCGEHTPESARFFAGASGIHQVLGLFRSLPFDEPRLAALALRTATDRFAGAIERLGAWAFAEDGTQRLAAFGSARGRMAFVWSSNPKMAVGGWTSEMRAAIGGCKVLDWTGREVKVADMKPLRVYFVIEPDLAAAAKGGVKLDHLDFVTYNYKKPVDLAVGKYAPLSAPVWNACSDGEGRFAVALDADALTLRVHRRGDQLSKVLFAVDVVGKGLLDDVADFEIRADGTIVKLRTPALMGDIPSEFSPAGVPLVKSRLETSAADGEDVWTVRIAMSDLYPYIYAPNRELPCSLVLTGAKGTSTWGGGLGRIRKTAEFGRLHPSGGCAVVAQQKDFTVTKGTSPGLQAKVKFVPGSVVRLTGEIRGKGCVFVAAWLQGEKGRELGRVNGTGKANARGIEPTADWQTVDIHWEMPSDAHSANVRLFNWRDPEASFETRNLRLVNE